MKNLVVIVTAVFFLASFSADAQMQQRENDQKGQQGMMMQGDMQQNMMRGMMMQGGMQQNMMGGMMCPMHQGMMGGQQMPMRKYMMMVNMLPNMQEPLSLSQEQVEQLIDMRTSFKKQQLDHMGDLTKKRMNLQNMMMNDASAGDIKTQLQECSSTMINMKVMAYETANDMKSVLTEEQRESMQNMMQKMQDGMQQGGMKQGDGMQQDGMQQMN